MRAKTILRVLLIHLGFHTLWVVVYLVSLLGVFMLIPFVGLYMAFVLGFLGKSVLESTTVAVLLGYLVFSVTGLLSGWFISLFRPKAAWIPAFVSLFLTGILLMSATWIRYKYIGVAGLETILPLPATTGRADVDRLSMALKAEYHAAGEVPAYFTEKPFIMPLSEVQPSLRLLPKDFQIQGGPYVYCNLSPQIWNGLKKEAGTAEYPLLWSTKSETSGKRLVMSIDLKTDIVNDELVSEEILNQMLSVLERSVQKQTGDLSFKVQD